MTTNERTTAVTDTLDLDLATESQIALYTRLVEEYVALTGYPREAADSAIAKFPNFSKRTASGRIDRVIASLKKARAEQPPAVEPEFAVWPGTYTVETETDRRTFRVSVQPSDAKFAPNSVIIEVLNGPNNTEDFTGFAFLDGKTLRPWKRFKDASDLLEFAQRLVDDPEAALVAKHCARCGEVLTVPESIRRGYGPVCARKGVR
jgi:hypothetical protein